MRIDEDSDYREGVVLDEPATADGQHGSVVDCGMRKVNHFNPLTPEDGYRTQGVKQEVYTVQHVCMWHCISSIPVGPRTIIRTNSIAVLPRCISSQSPLCSYGPRDNEAGSTYTGLCTPHDCLQCWGCCPMSSPRLYALHCILSTAWQFPCIRNLYPQSCSCTAICHCRMCKYTSPSNLVCGSLSSWRSPRKWVCVCLKNPFVPYIEKTCGRLCIYWLELSRTEMQNLYKFLGISATWENSALIHFVHALTLHALIARVNSCCFIHC